MATTKIWKVQKRLDHVINYATNEEKTKNNYSEYGMDEFDSIRQVMTYTTNPDKTEKQFYTTGINCEVKDAVKQMQFVKTLYGKENGILAFHAYQSFNEGEVTPEIAHEIGVKLANESMVLINSLFKEFSTGICSMTQFILSCPCGASLASRIIDFILFPPSSFRLTVGSLLYRGL